MAKVSIGLDIGTSGVRAAQLGLGRAPVALDGFGQFALARGAIQDGEIVDPGVVSEALGQLWKHARLKGKKVAVGVANQKVVVRPIDLPYMPEEELRGAIQFQVQEYIPIPVEDAVLDFQILDEYVTEGNERMMRVLLVAAQKDMISNLITAVEGAGLDPVAVDVTPLALVRALGSRGDGLGGGAGEAIIDIGGGITNVVIHEGGVTRFVRILLTGGNALTDSLASGMGVAFEEAEGIKQRQGLAPDAASGAAATDSSAQILEQRAGAFIDEIRGTLDYYAAQADAIQINRVVLTGGGSKLTNLGSRLAEATRLTGERGQVMQRMKVGKLGLSDQQLADAEPLMGAAVGLAMGESDE